MNANKTLRNLMLTAALVVGAGAFAPPIVPAYAAAPTPVPISQVPLTSASPIRPQVLFAVGNSESMDGTLSGAIMAGSGALSNGNLSLAASSSPVVYQVPNGFTPPLNAGTTCVSPLTGNCAPYTVNSGGTLYDNGASRLNVAKGAMQAILNSYMQNTDFGLVDYQTGSPTRYTTWVYYMSPAGGFTFTATPPAGNRYVINPCFGYLTASSTVKSNCSSIANLYGSATLSGNQYMLVGASSDDPNINDVLYAGGLASVGVAYNGPSPANPFSYYSLAQYNASLGNILSTYYNSYPGSVATQTTPTNAGYIPFSPQVMYSLRGFGYGASQSASTGHLVVPMTSAGQAPTTSSVATAISQFTNALAPETNNTDSSEIKASAGQASTPGLLAKALSYLQTRPNPSGYTSAQLAGCNINRYVILITDGLPTMDASGGNWPPLGSLSATGFGVSATFDPTTGALTTTNDQALTDTISAITALNTAGIKTYVVGLGAAVNPSLNNVAAQTLNAMAVAGGTYNPGFNTPQINVGYGTGTLPAGYLAATSPAALVTSLNTVLVQIQAGTQSTTSAAVNSATISSNTTIYQTRYTSSDTPYQDWTGNLLAFPIVNGTVNTATSNATWQAELQLDRQVCGAGVVEPLGGPNGGAGGCANNIANRFIATWNPVSDTGVPFEWANLSPAQQAQLGSTTAAGQNVLDYLRGDTALEQRNSGTYRNRSHLLGDITDSNPIYVGAPNGPYGDASYLAFVTAQATRTPALYVGANDGMLHAFNASNGNENFAYIPDGVFANLQKLTQPLYNQAHLFFVDGSPAAGDALLSSDGKWHTLLVGGEGPGGSSVFALDVTNPTVTTEAQLASKVLWEYNANGSDPDMGLSYGEPVITRINANSVLDTSDNQTVPGFAVFFGNGYNSPNQSDVLYAVKAGSGTLLRKIDLCAAVAGACNASLPNGLSGVVAANANGLLGSPADMVYAGDLQGNLWAVNVSNSNPASWTVRLLFTARDASGNRQPITTTPTVTLNPNYPNQPGLMLFFGTGQLLGTGDLSTSQVQSFYGVWDNGTSTGLLRANLQQQTITNVAAGTLDSQHNALAQTARTITSNPVNWSTQSGWYFDLPGPISGNTPSERVITSPLIENGGVVFTTYTPPPNGSLTCNATGTSFLMDVNYINGGAFTQPRLGLGLNGNFVSVGGNNPVGTQLSGGYAAAPTILTNPSGGGNIYTPGSNLQIPVTPEQYGGRSRLGWWQVQ
ncbi:pilus assembly protein [Metallibacterium sp.]